MGTVVRGLILVGLGLAAIVQGEPAEPEVSDQVASDLAGPARGARLELHPRLSLLRLTTLDLGFAGQRISYTSVVEALPAFHLTLNRGIGHWRGFQFVLHGSAGVATRSAITPVYSTQFGGDPTVGLPSFWDIRLNVVPILAGIRTLYRSPDFPFIQPGLSIGGGWVGFIQRSSNALFNRTTGIPVLVVSPSVTFAEATSVHWLAGFSFGFTWLQGLSPAMQLSASSLDLSIHLWL